MTPGRFLFTWVHGRLSRRRSVDAKLGNGR